MTTTDPAVPSTAPQPAPLDLDAAVRRAQQAIAAVNALTNALEMSHPDPPQHDWDGAIHAALHNVPALVAEVRRLRAELDNEQAAHAKTCANFDDFAEGTEDTAGQLRDARRQVETWRGRALGAEALLDRLDAAAAAPRRYELPPEPPPDVTELWDRNDDRWTPDGDDAHKGYRFWRRERDGWVAHYPTVLDHCGPLSTVPPAGTACPNCNGIGPESCPQCSPAAGTEGDQ